MSDYLAQHNCCPQREATTLLFPAKTDAVGELEKLRKIREVDLSDQSSLDKPRLAVLGLGMWVSRQLLALWSWAGRSLVPMKTRPRWQWSRPARRPSTSPA